MTRDDKPRPILVTGGAGFMGSWFVAEWLRAEGTPVVNVDKLTYAGSRESLADLAEDPRHQLVVADIRDRETLRELFDEHSPRAVVHLAAESHVDRSIEAPSVFAGTNVLGTSVLLEESTRFWRALPTDAAVRFRFLYVSTDEVFGPSEEGELFDESAPMRPVSPYAASKAAGEMLATSFASTFGLPLLIANPSNNYGPRQHPEKLIPKMILAAAASRPLPIYGDGRQQRDWLHVADCCAALRALLQDGRPGERFIVATGTLRTNLDVVQQIRQLVASTLNQPDGSTSAIEHVQDRPGHDRRYGLDPSSIQQRLGWKPVVSFGDGLPETVAWYLGNADWVSALCEPADCGAADHGAE